MYILTAAFTITAGKKLSLQTYFVGKFEKSDVRHLLFNILIFSALFQACRNLYIMGEKNKQTNKQKKPTSPLSTDFPLSLGGTKCS